VYSDKAKKLASTMLGLILLLTIFNMLIPFSYAAEWLSIPDTRLTWDESVDSAPSITQAQDGRIWIFWHSFEIGTNPDILYKVYNKSSTFPWSSAKKLTTHPSDDRMPSAITTADGKLWVVWSSDRAGNFEIYYKIYNGFSWSPDTRLTNHPSKDESPSVIQDKDDDIWVVWSSDRTGNSEIYYRIYNGSSWQPEGQLTWNSIQDLDPPLDPSITQVQDDKFWIVWERNENLYFKVIFKNMTVDTPDTQLTTGSDRDEHPSIIQTQDGAIWIAWATEKSTNQTDIYCKIFNSSLPSEQRITYNGKDDLTPAIMQAADGTIWIAWTSTRLSNFDIYYKTDSPPQHNHDVAIFSFTRNPSLTCTFRGLKNISIEIVPQNQGVESEDFTVRWYLNSTIMGSQGLHLSAGQLMPINFLWNTLDTAPGTYTITAEVSIVHDEIDTADNTLTSGMIQIRLPGDADFNGLVELPDYYLWVDNFGRTPGQCPPGIYPDFDNSGLVEMLDFYIWVENIGAMYP